MAESLAMHLILLERRADQGQMYSIYLPAEHEGRFSFQDRFGNDGELPLFVVARGDDWVLYSSEEAQFDHRERHLPDKEVVLRPHMMLGVTLAGGRYDLLVEEDEGQGRVFISYSLPSGDRDITIGRSTDSDIYYENGNVSRKHAVIRMRNGSLHISDTNSTNGTYVNGVRMTEKDLALGDCVFIMGLYLIIGPGYVAINNARGRCQVLPEVMRPLENAGELRYMPVLSHLGCEEFFNRQPRRMYELKPDPIEISLPPVPMSGSRIPLMLRMGSPALMGGRAIASGNYTMALSSMVLPFITQGLTEKDRQEYEQRRRTKYLEYLQGKENEIRQEREYEKKVMNEIHPSLTDAVDFAIDRRQRLWEIRSVDSDFLQVRLGTGRIPMKAQLQYPRESFDLDEDVLKTSMYNLVKQDFSIPNAPVLLSLREKYIVGLCGAAEYVQRLAANLVIQLALTHSYDEVKLVLLAEPRDTEYIREEMHLFRYLPHCWDNLRSIRFIAECKEDACLVGEYLKKQIDTSTEASNAVLSPAYVIIALDRQMLDCLESLKDVISAREYRGITIVTGFEGPLKESMALLNMNNRSGVLMDLSESEVNDVPYILERCDRDRLRMSLRQVMRTRLRLEAGTFTLPKVHTFLEMFNASKVEYLNPLSRWKEKNPTKSLATPIGIGTDGKPMLLDLHEKRQGPHGLIAGTTGSGKSEFIMTYILSMAVNYSPEEVAFVLIDYKGGGLTNAFEDPDRGLHLPHVVGTITNLDGSTIQRSLTSITSELERRERLFKEAASQNNEGKVEIYDYQRLYRAGKVKEPLPHLFLIADEFAELKKQQPDFMAALISTARIGRSLGVHLILATQKPGGVVSDEIWTNTRFRVCLKVADRSDSVEMLKRPEAAELKETGRFYLQVGYNEYFALGQSAWCGAEYIPQEQVISQVDESVEFLDTTGQVALSCKPPVLQRESGVSQLVAIVELLSNLSRQHELSARALWLPPLPAMLDLDRVDREALRSPEEGLIATIGMVDDPKHQCQMPLQLDMLSFHHMLICGTAGSGKSTLIRTLLYTLCRQYAPEDVQYYLVDLSGGALSTFRDMPHCGAYLTDGQDMELSSLMNMLRDIVAERKARLLEAGVTNFNAYRQMEKLPLVLLVIDGYANITNFSQGTAFNNEFFQFLREAAPYGVRVVASVNHLNEMHSRARMEIDYRIALQAKDRYDYTEILDMRTMLTAPNVPGRGLCVYGDTVLEYQVAIPDPALGELERMAAMRERLAELGRRWGDASVTRRLPHIDDAQTYADFCALFPKGRIPLGYNRADARPVAIPLRQLHKAALYFGNPRGIQSVLGNLLYAAEREGMRVTVLRRQSQSLFLTRQPGDLLTVMPDTAEFYETNAEGVEQFYSDFHDEIARRNQFRDEYCQAHGIPSTDKGRILRAANYMRQKTAPWLILFESFADFCLSGADPELFNQFTVFLKRTRGYNVYFFGLFYPEDIENVNRHPLVQVFCQEQFLMMFGGRFDRSCIVEGGLTDIRSASRMASRTDRFLMKYRDGVYNMQMPCGGTGSQEIDPDEQAIV